MLELDDLNDILQPFENKLLSVEDSMQIIKAYPFNLSDYDNLLKVSKYLVEDEHNY